MVITFNRSPRSTPPPLQDCQVLANPVCYLPFTIDLTHLPHKSTVFEETFRWLFSEFFCSFHHSSSRREIIYCKRAILSLSSSKILIDPPSPSPPEYVILDDFLSFYPGYTRALPGVFRWSRIFYILDKSAITWCNCILPELVVLVDFVFPWGLEYPVVFLSHSLFTLWCLQFS